MSRSEKEALTNATELLRQGKELRRAVSEGRYKIVESTPQPKKK